MQTRQTPGGRTGGSSQVNGATTASIDDRPRCRRCRHPLTTHLAIEAGFGPTCAMHILGNPPRRAREQFIGQATLPGLEAVA